MRVECSFCGKPKQTDRYKYEQQANHFCDIRCQSEWRKTNATGAKAGGWRGGTIERQCAYCGKPVRIHPWQAKRFNMSFCQGAECKGNWWHENMCGENHGRWRGGREAGRPKWAQTVDARRWRRECRRRDNYTCQRCGRTFDKHSPGLHVHHIVAYRDDESLRACEDNGICLCQPCHVFLHTRSGAQELEAFREEFLGAFAGLEVVV